jgi:hypothetical protein
MRRIGNRGFFDPARDRGSAAVCGSVAAGDARNGDCGLLLVVEGVMVA